MLIYSRFLAFGLIGLWCLQAQQPDISPERIRAHVKFVSSDQLEGRGPGGRGGQLATEYMGTQFMLAGVKPGGENGKYFQHEQHDGVKTGNSAQLTALIGGHVDAFSGTYVIA